VEEGTNFAIRRGARCIYFYFVVATVLARSRHTWRFFGLLS
jgi:hypothetical protein